MGRKLNALEEIQSSLQNAEADRRTDLARLQRNLQLQRQIADQLGISTAQLRAPRPSSDVVQDIGVVRPDDGVLQRQCSDLVEAFTRIQDPEDRLRCLRIVRDAALGKGPGT